jgi:intein/homing endonuclease
MAKIINKKNIGKSKVYDICMPTNHCFYANDILVHNCDLEDRDLLVGKDKKSGYLYERWGDKAAQVSTRTMLRLKSAIKDTNRYVKGKVEPSIEIFTKSLPAPPQGVTDNEFIFGFEDQEGEHTDGLIETNEDLLKYTEERPEEWSMVQKMLGITRAQSLHACISGDALVDDNGNVSKFKNSKFSTNKPIKVWSNGFKETILVSLNNGISIRCTPDHKFITLNGEIEAKDLYHKEVIYKPFNNASGKLELDKELLFALGWGLNDGTFVKERTNQCFYFTPGKDDEARNKILCFLDNCNVTHWITNGRPDQLFCGSINLSELFFESKLTKEQRLPDYFWKLSYKNQCVFMHGFMSANGYVLSTVDRIGFKLSSKLLVSDICTWMLSNGINTSATYLQPQTFVIRGKECKNNGSAEICITGFESKQKFKQDISFIQEYKKTRLNQIAVKKKKKDSSSNRNKPIRCLNIENTGLEEVFDFNEPLENIGFINGILVHNCAFVIADVPITHVVPTRSGHVTQYTAGDVEAAGLVKYDFLVISQLKDIRVCLDFVNKHDNSGLQFDHLLHKGIATYVWDLPEELEVFKSVWGGDTESIFQISTKSMIPYVMSIKPQSIEDLAIILSLVRPGPLDYIDPNTGRSMAEEYVHRRRGGEYQDIEILKELIPETHSVLCIKKGSKVKTTNGLINIEDVKVGQKVQTEDGSYQNVLNNYYKGNKKTIKIRLDNSEELELTRDHKVLTSTGWVEAEKLTNRDLVKHFWASDAKIEEGTIRDWIVGLVLADGNVCSSTVDICAGNNKNIAEKIKDIVDKEFSINSTIYFHCRSYYIRLANKGDTFTKKGSNPVTELFRNLGIYGKNSYNKEFPKFITKKMIEGFVEGDGCVSNGTIRIKNKKIARSLFETLQALRIKSSLFFNEKDGVDTVTFDSSKLEFQFKKEIYNNKKGLYYPKSIVSFEKIKGYDKQYFYPKKLVKTPFISEYKLNRLEKIYNFEANKNQSWSKVISVNEGDVCEVYDLSVDTNHSFVVGGNVVHNCYQEQVTKIARELAGFDGSAAEKLREAIGKKKLTTLLAIKPKFVSGCVASSKVTKEEAEELWDRIATFGRYAFNKSHAVSYAFVTYACMFLRHHKKIDWWAAVATNADEKEITGKFWPHLKPYFASPDINLSTDEMVIDYKNEKIRAKLGVIRGMGDKSALPIIEARPYADITDFVKKDVATDSLTRKLIHVGVLDSLFPPKLTFLEKLKMFEDCLQVQSFEAKKAKATDEGKKFKAIAPKEGILPDKYLNLHPMTEAAMKKAVLPSLVVGLYDLGGRYSKAIDPKSKHGIWMLNSRKIPTLFINSEFLLQLSETDGNNIDKDLYVAATGYVNEIKEFTYSNDTKKALKLNLDFDGISLGEVVQWPSFDSGELKYDKDTKKGSIVTVFFRKKVGKKELNVQEFILESTPESKNT